jgi:2-methylcitrate dehydratase
LHPQVESRLAEIARIEIETQEPAVRIIDKKGPLKNFADRDHCLQYMVAVGMVFGNLTADHYQDRVAADPRIDALREKMIVRENQAFTADYYDLEKRAIGNAIQVFFDDGSRTERLEVLYPLGHRRRREEGLEALRQKFRENTRLLYSNNQANRVIQLVENQAQLDEMAVSDFLDLLVCQSNRLETLLA